MLPAGAWTDRAALAEALSAQGVADAAALVREHAAPALRLALAPEAEDRPAAVLHGKGLLPAGAAWPHSSAGRPLAFLAGVDFSQVRLTIEGAPALPTVGWLLFFADVDDPTGYDPARWQEPQPTPEGWAQGKFDGSPAPNAPGSVARVLWVPSGVEPVAGQPPGLRALGRAEERRIAVEQLTLPDGWDARELELSKSDLTSFVDVAGRLRHGFSGHRPQGVWNPDDWVLGAATGAQGDTPNDGSVLLLHLASVDFQDGGIIQFRMPSEALAAQDWTQIYAMAESG